MHPTGGRMSDTVIRAAARALNPDRPIKMLAGLANGRRSTGKSWATGHRRAPIVRPALRARERTRAREIIEEFSLGSIASPVRVQRCRALAVITPIVPTSELV